MSWNTSHHLLYGNKNKVEYRSFDKVYMILFKRKTHSRNYLQNNSGQLFISRS